MSWIKYVLLSSAFLFIMGCASASVYNVKTKTFEDVSSLSMKNAVLNAGEELGWMMKEDGSNRIIGLMRIKDYQAKIAVDYTTDSYSIQLLEAKNMKYDAQKQMIKRGYNTWILQLESKIDGLVKPLKMSATLQKKELQAHKDKENLASLKSSELKKPGSKGLVLVGQFHGNLHEIYDVMNTPISQVHTLQEVEQAILTAGRQYDWMMKKQEDGFILAKKIVRHHVAIARIAYSQKEYSITYITSEKLHYQTYHVHQNYNIWVKELETGINYNLQ